MKVAIIGAGNSGLLSLKNCIDEKIEADCYEMTDRVGGLWSPHEPEYGISTAYKHLITNSSKEMMAFSDHAFPANFPSYLTRDMVYEYICSYCARFNLYDHIKLEHKVHKVEKTADYDVTGCWNVTVEDLKGKSGPTTLRYDGVIIGTGINAFPYTPQIPGMDKFKGKITHSHSYTSHKDYGRDERIVVLGNASSGVDIATDLANRDGPSKRSNGSSHNGTNGVNGASLTEKPPVYISARSGVALFQRNYSSPVDMMWSLFYATLYWLFPKLSLKIMATIFRLKQKDFGKHKFPRFCDDPSAVVNDDIWSCLEEGTVKHAPGIVKFTEDGVMLSDGQYLKADHVIMGTGYEIKVPMVDKDIIDPDHWWMFKRVWPVHLKKNTLAVVGFVRINGQVPPVTELQARWVVQVFAGKVKLPSYEEMKSRTPVFVKDETRLSRKIHVTVIEYCSEIASYIGCHPRKLMFTHPYRWFVSYFGPAFPFIYRQVGPGNSADAWKNVALAKSRIHPFPHKIE